MIYAASGNAYADPAPGTSDAIIAFSIETGEIEWINQVIPGGDIWILGCNAQSTGGNDGEGDNPNCPEDVGPDFDFSASPGLITLADGRDLLVVTQKSGVGYALDPDREGAVVWEYRWGSRKSGRRCLGVDDRWRTRLLRCRGSVHAGARRTARRRRCHRRARLGPAAGADAVRGRSGVQRGPIGGVDVDSGCRVFRVRRRRHASLRRADGRHHLGFRHEPEFRHRQRRCSQWGLHGWTRPGRRRRHAVCHLRQWRHRRDAGQRATGVRTRRIGAMPTALCLRG